MNTSLREDKCQIHGGGKILAHIEYALVRVAWNLGLVQPQDHRQAVVRPELHGLAGPGAHNVDQGATIKAADPCVPRERERERRKRERERKRRKREREREKERERERERRRRK